MFLVKNEIRVSFWVFSTFFFRVEQLLIETHSGKLSTFFYENNNYCLRMRCIFKGFLDMQISHCAQCMMWPTFHAHCADDKEKLERGTRVGCAL